MENETISYYQFKISRYFSYNNQHRRSEQENSNKIDDIILSTKTSAECEGSMQWISYLYQECTDYS